MIPPKDVGRFVLRIALSTCTKNSCTSTGQRTQTQANRRVRLRSQVLAVGICWQHRLKRHADERVHACTELHFPSRSLRIAIRFIDSAILFCCGICTVTMHLVADSTGCGHSSLPPSDSSLHVAAFLDRYTFRLNDRGEKEKKEETYSEISEINMAVVVDVQPFAQNLLCPFRVQATCITEEFVRKPLP